MVSGTFLSPREGHVEHPSQKSVTHFRKRKLWGPGRLISHRELYGEGGSEESAGHMALPLGESSQSLSDFIKKNKKKALFLNHHPVL